MLVTSMTRFIDHLCSPEALGFGRFFRNGHESVGYSLVKLRTIRFECQDIVTAPFVNLLGNGRLTSHRIDGDQRILEFKLFEQCGNRRDFIVFGVGRFLA